MSAWVLAGVAVAGALGAVLRVGADDAWLALRASRTERRASADRDREAALEAAEGHTGPVDAPEDTGDRLGALRAAAAAWPWPLLVVNLVGSFLLGWATSAVTGADWRAIIGAGLCGGLTTFSTWAVVISGAVRDRAWGRAVSVLLGHVLLGVGAAALGLALG